VRSLLREPPIDEVAIVLRHHMLLSVRIKDGWLIVCGRWNGHCEATPNRRQPSRGVQSPCHARRPLTRFDLPQRLVGRGVPRAGLRIRATGMDLPVSKGPTWLGTGVS